MDSDSIEIERNVIEKIDLEIIRLISERTEAARRIGEMKRKSGLAVKDQSAEENVVRRYRGNASSYNLPEDDLEAVAWMLISIAVNAEQE